MEQADQELLRRTLVSILKRIEGGGASPAMMSTLPGQSREAAEPPVIVVMLGQANSTDDKVLENQPSHEAQPGGRPGSDASHPGLKRFPISSACAADVPKNCFMEPDRICVNSGACEMLGH